MEAISSIYSCSLFVCTCLTPFVTFLGPHYVVSRFQFFGIFIQLNNFHFLGSTQKVHFQATTLFFDRLTDQPSKIYIYRSSWLEHKKLKSIFLHNPNQYQISTFVKSVYQCWCQCISCSTSKIKGFFSCQYP